MKMYPAHLMDREGRYVCYQDMLQPHQLFAMILQDPGKSNTVCVYEIKKKKHEKEYKYMAFCFEKGKTSIFPVVTDDEKLDLKHINSDEITVQTFDESFLFQLGNGRNSPLNSLKSVAKPSKYLCFEKDNMCTVTLGSDDMPDFRIEKLPNKVQDEKPMVRTRNMFNKRAFCFEKSVFPTNKSKRMKMSVKS